MQIDAGADLVVTQLFYDVELFIKFEKDCRSVGITCPIIPGTLHSTRSSGGLQSSFGKNPCQASSWD